MNYQCNSLGFYGYRAASHGIGDARNAPSAGGSHYVAASPLYYLNPRRVRGVGFYDAFGPDSGSNEFNNGGSIWEEFFPGGGGYGPILTGPTTVPTINYTPVGGGGGVSTPTTGSTGTSGGCTLPTNSTNPADIANAVENLLKDNVTAYLTGQKTKTDALAYFDQLWACMAAKCGAACTTDRQAGACKWQQNGKCWNWYVGYRDPIANGNATYTGGGTTGTNVLGLPSTVAGVSTNVLLIAAVIIMMGAMMGGRK